MIKQLFFAAFGVALCSPVFADDDDGCAIPAGTVKKIQDQLKNVVTMSNGGLFSPNRMWSAVVDRTGKVCSVIRSDPDAWPNSRAIALAKANTANGLSNNLLAVSTANWYSAAQPGGSLSGLDNSNPFNPDFLIPATPDPALGKYAGGMITFGGGVALYDSSKIIIGGLGVSGDTSCADHAIAYRMRHAASLDHIPGGPVGGTDNISYLATGEAPNGFKHPHCTDHDVTP